MGRKKKFVNNTPYPDWVIERIARCLYDDMVAYYATEEGQREYAAWEAEQSRRKSVQKSRFGKVQANDCVFLNRVPGVWGG